MVDVGGSLAAAVTADRTRIMPAAKRALVIASLT